MAAVVVADASVLIALDQIGQLSLLQKLFGVVLVPPAVIREVAPSLHQLPSWVQTRPLERPPDARVKSSLDPGETEAICLALEVKADRIILDDLPARYLAKNLGIPIVGTAGVLFTAKQRGFITSVTDNALKRQGKAAVFTARRPRRTTLPARVRALETLWEARPPAHQAWPLS